MTNVVVRLKQKTIRGGNMRADATLCKALQAYPKYLRQTRHY
jgi:hypothetical protein